MSLEIAVAPDLTNYSYLACTSSSFMAPFDTTLPDFAYSSFLLFCPLFSSSFFSYYRDGLDSFLLNEYGSSMTESAVDYFGCSTGAGFATADGPNELKKSSVSKSMSSFFAAVFDV